MPSSEPQPASPSPQNEGMDERSDDDAGAVAGEPESTTPVDGDLDTEPAADGVADDELPGWWVRASEHGPSWLGTVAVVIAALFVGAAAYAGIRALVDRPNATDVGFSDDMTTHHFQALRLSYLYLQHGEDPVLISTAKEIIMAQSGEIQRFQEMISGWGSEVSSDVAMEWMGMSVDQEHQPGMASDADIKRLSELKGSELDDLWSTLMIRHHGGGVHMAREALKAANNSVIRAIAERTVKVQEMEINEMNHWRVKNGHQVVKPDVD